MKKTLIAIVIVIVVIVAGVMISLSSSLPGTNNGTQNTQDTVQGTQAAGAGSSGASVGASSGTQGSQQGSNSGTAASTSTAAAPNTFTMAVVATHDTSSSCWTAINGSVYDVTSWISQHPGGSEAIISLCGIDGSSAFNDQHGGQRRPANELAGFKIGTLAK